MEANIEDQALSVCKELFSRGPVSERPQHPAEDNIRGILCTKQWKNLMELHAQDANCTSQLSGHQATMLTQEIEYTLEMATKHHLSESSETQLSGEGNVDGTAGNGATTLEESDAGLGVIDFIGTIFKHLCPFSESLEYSTLIPQRSFLSKVQPKRLLQFVGRTLEQFVAASAVVTEVAALRASWYNLLDNALNVIPCYVIRRSTLKALLKDACDILLSPSMTGYALLTELPESSDTKQTLLRLLKQCFFNSEVLPSFGASLELFEGIQSAGTQSEPPKKKRKMSKRSAKSLEETKTLDVVSTVAKTFFTKLGKILEDEDTPNKSFEIGFPLLTALYVHELREMGSIPQEEFRKCSNGFAGELCLILQRHLKHFQTDSCVQRRVSSYCSTMRTLRNIFSVYKEKHLFLDGNQVLHPEFLRGLLENATTCNEHLEQLLEDVPTPEDYIEIGHSMVSLFCTANDFNADFLLGTHSMFLERIVKVFAGNEKISGSVFHEISEALQSSVDVHSVTRSLPNFPELLHDSCVRIYSRSGARGVKVFCDTIGNLSFGKTIYMAFCNAPTGQHKSIWSGFHSCVKRILEAPRIEDDDFKAETLFLHISLLCDVMRSSMTSKKSLGPIKDLMLSGSKEILVPLESLIARMETRRLRLLLTCCYQMFYVNFVMTCSAIGMVDSLVGQTVLGSVSEPVTTSIQLDASYDYAEGDEHLRMKIYRTMLLSHQCRHKVSLHKLPLQSAERSLQFTSTKHYEGVHQLATPVWQVNGATSEFAQKFTLSPGAQMVDSAVSDSLSGPALSLTLLRTFQELWLACRPKRLSELDKTIKELNLDSCKTQTRHILYGIFQSGVEKRPPENKDSAVSRIPTLELVDTYPSICIDGYIAVYFYILFGAIWLVSRSRVGFQKAWGYLNWLYPNVIRCEFVSFDDSGFPAFRDCFKHVARRYTYIDEFDITPKAAEVALLCSALCSRRDKKRSPTVELTEAVSIDASLGHEHFNGMLRLIAQRKFIPSVEGSQQLMDSLLQRGTGAWETPLDNTVLAIGDFASSMPLPDDLHSVSPLNLPLVLVVSGQRKELTEALASSVISRTAILFDYENGMECLYRSLASVTRLCEVGDEEVLGPLCKAIKSYIGKGPSKTNAGNFQFICTLRYLRAFLSGIASLREITAVVIANLHESFEHLYRICNSAILSRKFMNPEGSPLVIECFLTCSAMVKSTHVNVDSRNVTALISSTEVSIDSALGSGAIQGIIAAACHLVYALLRYRSNICANLAPILFDRLRKLMYGVLRSTEVLSLKEATDLAQHWNRLCDECVRSLGTNSTRQYAVGILGALLKQHGLSVSSPVDKTLYDGAFFICDTLTDREWEELYANLQKSQGAVANLKELKKSYDKEHKFTGKI
eukprot:gb/GECG01012504.1/.p1 GENE.gb/GECG01012504.1/~~gb/GECG01012504.1/.p1  ORF type:complete len:1389 (+),score=163.84 gb/GECG01012504.1/:1-4167(+)